jgi:hypothetical protein
MAPAYNKLETRGKLQHRNLGLVFVKLLPKLPLLR